MNGVRRFLGGGGSSTPATPEPLSPPALPATAPLAISSKPSWPPTSPTTQSPASSPPRDAPPSTPALFFRKDKSKPQLDGDGSSSRASSAVNSPTGRSQTSLPQSPIAGPSSPRAVPSRVSQLSRKSVGTEWKRSSQMSNVRDDLLTSLLASEAIVDSRGYDVLSAEEVDELKREQQVLSSRLVAMNKKLTLETKIRDAALSLSKANASYKNVSKQTTEQLDTANKKVEVAQRELWRVSDRYNEVQRKLLEHRAGVLSRSVRNLEKQSTPTEDTATSGYSTPNRSSQMSPVTASSVTSIQSASSKGRFDGAHLFAGHADAIGPIPRTPSRTVNGSAELEEKLQSASTALEAATAKQTEMEQELSLLRLEKEQVETSLGLELHGAEDTIKSLEQRVAKMESIEDQLQALSEEQAMWAQEHAELDQTRREAMEQRQAVEAKQRELEAKQQEVESLRSRLGALEVASGDAALMEGALAVERNAHMADLEKRDREMEEMKSMWEADKANWEVERATLMNDMRETSDKLRRDVQAGSSSQAQLDECVSSLNVLVQDHGISAASEDPSPTALVTSVRQHLEDLRSKLDILAQEQEQWMSRRTELETSLRMATDKHQAVFTELEQTKRERDDARSEVRNLEMQLQAQTAAAAVAAQASSQPPIEYKGDAGKLVAALQPIWAILPSAEARASKLGSRSLRSSSPNGNGSPVAARNGSSLAELDVRSLKSLYDPKGPVMATSAGGAFTIEAFAERVQALITDDRALVERLIRFAQAHDLLKKNAERAQKLAQDSNAALETYQKQVRTLEDRNISLMTLQAEMQEELQWLQESVERLQAEKLDIETQAAEQAETCVQLQEANNKLSARALIMAEEAASATDSVRKQFEAQLAEANSSLSKAREEMESIRQSQQSQQMALLEELNSTQNENTNLRAQLRAKK